MSRVTPFKSVVNRKVNGRESAAMTRLLLRNRARRIESREHFERIVAQAPHPEAVRRLLEPLLRPNLPCCGGPLRKADGLWVRSHTHGCPTRDGADHAPGGIGG